MPSSSGGLSPDRVRVEGFSEAELPAATLVPLRVKYLEEDTLDPPFTFASGKSATIPFTRGRSLRLVPNKLARFRKSSNPGAWLYRTTTLACDAEDACRSGDNFELSACARATVRTKQMTRNFFMKIESSSGRARPTSSPGEFAPVESQAPCRTSHQSCYVESISYGGALEIHAVGGVTICPAMTGLLQALG